MKPPKEVACELGFSVPVGPRAGRTQPVAGNQGGQAIPKASHKKSGKKSSRTKHPSSNSLQPVPVSGAKAQENRRKDKTDAGLCRVETWVPSQVAQHMKAKAKSQKMTGQEFLAKLITENLAKT